MLKDAGLLKGFTIVAQDGEIGRVTDVLFDEARWVVRYLVVETGNWLTGRKVLLSPQSVTAVDWEDECLRVALTREQVRNSPDIDAHMPVSRQKEVELSRYFNWPYYWGGMGLWGAGAFPVLLNPLPPGGPLPAPEDIPHDEADRHLYSLSEVRGYRFLAEDGEFGHLESLILDDSNWAIRYAVIDTVNFWPGKSVLMAPAWISDLSWDERRIHIGVNQELVRNAPEYDPAMQITRDYEERLYEYYGLAKYWDLEKAA